MLKAKPRDETKCMGFDQRLFDAKTDEDVRKAVQGGADVRAKSESGDISLHLALESKKPAEVVKALIVAEMQCTERRGVGAVLLCRRKRRHTKRGRDAAADEDALAKLAFAWIVLAALAVSAALVRELWPMPASGGEGGGGGEGHLAHAQRLAASGDEHTSVADACGADGNARAPRNDTGHRDVSPPRGGAWLKCAGLWLASAHGVMGRGGRGEAGVARGGAALALAAALGEAPLAEATDEQGYSTQNCVVCGDDEATRCDCYCDGHKAACTTMIESFADEPVNLPELEYMEFHSNPLWPERFTSFPEGFFSLLGSLTRLGLKESKITALRPGSFDGLTSLEYIDFSLCKLTSIPVGLFDKLSSMKHLGLRQMPGVRSLPDGVFAGLKSAPAWIEITNNPYLGEVPADVFAGLTALTRLDVWGYTRPGGVYPFLLPSLPDNAFADLASLTELQIGRTQFRTLPGLGALTSVKKLIIKENDLLTIPLNAFDSLTALTELDLRGNPLFCPRPPVCDEPHLIGSHALDTVRCGDTGSTPCSAHGTCSAVADADGNHCACHSGWATASCFAECPNNASAPCSGHGTCDDGASGTGVCECDPAYAPSTSCRARLDGCEACGATNSCGCQGCDTSSAVDCSLDALRAADKWEQPSLEYSITDGLRSIGALRLPTASSFDLSGNRALNSSGWPADSLLGTPSEVTINLDATGFDSSGGPPPPGTVWIAGTSLARTCAPGAAPTPAGKESSCAVCEPGYFCPRGSLNTTQHPCGDASKYCPGANGEPLDVPTGHEGTSTYGDPARQTGTERIRNVPPRVAAPAVSVANASHIGATSSANVAWPPTANATSYRLEFGEVRGDGADLAFCTVLESNATAAVVPNLLAETKYAFRVFARNAEGESPPGKVTHAQTPPIPCNLERAYRTDDRQACVVCPAGQQSTGTECEECRAGQWSSYGGRCEACPSGQAQPRSAQPRCEPCAAGDYALANASACAPCPANGVAGKGEASGDCATCDAGFAPDVERSKCEICPSGKHAAASASSCTACGETEAAPRGSEKCEVCGGGRVPNAERSLCTLCLNGTYSASASTNCTACIPGHVARAPGSSECEPCPAGTRELHRTQCELCKAGEFSTKGATHCSSNCSEGMIVPTGSTACIPCKGGFVPNERGDECDRCDAGHYARQGSSECSPCERDEVAPSGAPACTPCPHGFVPDHNHTRCEICPAGQRSNRTHCVGCANGTHAPAGRVRCEPCDAGYEPDENKTRCIVCPVATESPDGARCVPCAEGHAAPVNAPKCKPCEKGTAPSEKRDHCSSCKPGTWSNGTRCVPCGAREVAALGSSECKPCKDGEKPSKQGERCEVCDAGEEMEPSGNCVRCAPGHFAVHGSPNCTLCKEGEQAHDDRTHWCAR